MGKLSLQDRQLIALGLVLRSQSPASFEHLDIRVVVVEQLLERQSILLNLIALTLKSGQLRISEPLADRAVGEMPFERILQIVIGAQHAHILRVAFQ